MKISIEPEAEEDFKPEVYENVTEMVLVGQKIHLNWPITIHRTHTQNNEIIRLIGFLEMAKEALREIRDG